MVIGGKSTQLHISRNLCLFSQHAHCSSTCWATACLQQHEEHLEILSEKWLNTEAVLSTVTWANLVAPHLLPDILMVELLQALGVKQLREFGMSALASKSLFVMLLAVWAM